MAKRKTNHRTKKENSVSHSGGSMQDIKSLAKFPEENVNPVYRVSREGVLLYANPASRKLILTDQTKVGDKIPEKWIGMIKSVYDSKKKQSVELTFDGRIYSFEQVPVHGEGYVSVYGVDVTDRKKAEEVLKESETRLNMALKDSKITVFIQNKNLVYTWVYNPNDKLSPEKVIGKTDKDLVAKEDAAKLTKIKYQVLKTGKSHRSSVRFMINNVPYYYDLAVEANKDSSGKIIGIRGISVDVTEKKKTEQALQKAHDELEQRVEERTAELQKAKNELQKKVDELEKFSSLVVNREIKMVELKKRINELERKLINKK